MKIFKIEYENNKWEGETNITFTIAARNMKEAKSKADKILKDKEFGFTNWKIVKIELTAKTDI